MSYFVVTLSFVHELPPELLSAQQAHLRSLTEDEILMWSGRFGDGKGGMAILQSESEEEARALYERTPLATSGAITWDLRAWNGSAGVVPALLQK